MYCGRIFGKAENKLGASFLITVPYTLCLTKNELVHRLTKNESSCLIYHSSFFQDSTHLNYFGRSILNQLPCPSPFERRFSSMSYYVCEQSLHIICDAVSIVTSVIKLS